MPIVLEIRDLDSRGRLVGLDSILQRINIQSVNWQLLEVYGAGEVDGVGLADLEAVVANAINGLPVKLDWLLRLAQVEQLWSLTLVGVAAGITVSPAMSDADLLKVCDVIVQLFDGYWELAFKSDELGRSARALFAQVKSCGADAN